MGELNNSINRVVCVDVMWLFLGNIRVMTDCLFKNYYQREKESVWKACFI